MMKDGGSIVNTTVEKPSYTSEEEQVYEFKMECGAPWKIVSNPDWVHFDSSENDSGEYRSIKMIVDHNVGSAWEQTRSGQIVVRSYDGLDFTGSVLEEKKFTVWQDRFVFEVSDNTDELTFGALPSETKKFGITTLEEAGWELVDVLDWHGIPEEKRKGKGPEEISFKPKDYGMRESRSTAFNVKSTVLIDSPKIPIQVSQEGYVFKFDNSSSYDQSLTSFDALKSNNTKPKTKNVLCTGKWTVSDIPDWVEVKSGGSVISNGGSVNGDATLSFNANSTNTALAVIILERTV